MLQIGQMNSLKVVQAGSDQILLDSGDGQTIPLIDRSENDSIEVGHTLSVFVSYDSEDFLVASLQTPYAQVGEFAHLQVVALESVGAFLDWGLRKDLFLPFSEQTRALKVGQDVVVFLYLDNTSRICASMRLDRHIDKVPGNYREGQSVELMIAAETDLGFKAIINGRHWGILYSNEIFQPLKHGQQLPGVIKKIREDGKIDLTLQKLGHRAAEDIAPQILQLLEEQGGFLPYDNKTSAEIIYDIFGVSKKKYKMTLGTLYKQRLISIEPDGIRLVAKK